MLGLKNAGEALSYINSHAAAYSTVLAIASVQTVTCYVYQIISYIFMQPRFR